MTTAIEPRMRVTYREEVRPSLLKELGLENIMTVPCLEKIVLNMGVGLALTNRANLDGALSDLATITGQKPIITRAKKSIAGFKLREGNAIGAKVTMRGARMWEFYDRLVTLAIPRIRDFRGLSSRSFDGRGNYTFGVSEQLIFPEIDYDTVSARRGMDITLVTSAINDDHGRALLSALGFRSRGRDRTNGQKSTYRKAEAHPEVQGARLHALSAVRSTAFCLPQIRSVSRLPT